MLLTVNPAAQEYRKRLRERQEREAQTLASLTGWNVNDIRHWMNLAGTTDSSGSSERKWYEWLWRN